MNSDTYFRELLERESEPVKVAPRAKAAGIEIALVNELGQVIDVDA